jgi:DNA-3-methyladenine glycosylase
VHDSVDGSQRRGRIVEVEAYIGEDDRASHARFGRTARNAVMYGPPGVAYVYLVYGMYDCLNIVTEPVGRPAAILVRAVEPIEGEAVMRASRLERTLGRRKTRSAASDALAAARLARLPTARLAAGPGLVSAAFGIDRSFTGRDLLAPDADLRLELAPADEPQPVVIATPRLGIDFAGSPWTEVPWRFTIAGHLSVSGPGTDRRPAGAR